MKLNKLIVLLLCLLLMQAQQVLAQRIKTDAKATALAKKVLANMGGEQNWNNTRYLAWTFNDQYQIWDKHQNKFRWERDSLVAILDTETKSGKVYADGKQVPESAEKQKLLERTYALWINNAYWLVMPFKLQDPGVRLTYAGEGSTMAGEKADVLEMSFESVGLTPQNKYKLWVSKEAGLITQWAFYRNSTDAEPTFTRRWSDYKTYGSIKLASDRSNPQGDFKLTNLAVPSHIPAQVFNSPLPINKASIK